MPVKLSVDAPLAITTTEGTMTFPADQLPLIQQWFAQTVTELNQLMADKVRDQINPNIIGVGMAKPATKRRGRPPGSTKAAKTTRSRRKMFPCPDCGQKFPSPNALGGHRSSHSKR